MTPQASPSRRHHIEIEVTTRDDEIENLCDALLAVADLLDPGQVDMTAGPAGEAS